jgi:hypothetical protein
MATRGSARWRRRSAAVLILGVTILAAAIVYLVGLFSDWSGQHRVPVETTIGAIAILVVGALVAFRVVRS